MFIPSARTWTTNNQPVPSGGIARPSCRVILGRKNTILIVPLHFLCRHHHWLLEISQDTLNSREDTTISKGFSCFSDIWSFLLQCGKPCKCSLQARLWDTQTQSSLPLHLRIHPLRILRNSSNLRDIKMDRRFPGQGCLPTRSGCLGPSSLILRGPEMLQQSNKMQGWGSKPSLLALCRWTLQWLPPFPSQESSWSILKTLDANQPLFLYHPGNWIICIGFNSQKLGFYLAPKAEFNGSYLGFEI